MNRLSFVALIFSTLSLLTGTAFAASLDKVQFIKIAPQDQKAVIKAADGKLRVIKPGDLIGETVTVKEIATGKPTSLADLAIPTASALLVIVTAASMSAPPSRSAAAWGRWYAAASSTLLGASTT